MRFLKEMIALIVIIVFLVVTDWYINSFTDNSIKEINKKMDSIMENALNKENYIQEEEMAKIEDFEKEWKKIENKLAYFTEHDELEKVTVTIIMMKGDVEAGLKEDAYTKMQEIKYRIEHIKSKQRMKLNNMF